MGKLVKRLCVKLLAAAAVCGMMFPLAAFAQESETEIVTDVLSEESIEPTEETETARDDEKNGPKVSISGLGDTVQAGEEGVLSIDVESDQDMTGWYVKVWFVYDDGYEDGGESIYLINGKAEVSYEIRDAADADSGRIRYTGYVYNSSGSREQFFQGWVKIKEKEDESEDQITGKIGLTAAYEAATGEVAAGKAYPFTLTVTNNSDETLTDIMVSVLNIRAGLVEALWRADIILDGETATGSVEREIRGWRVCYPPGDYYIS